MMNARQVAFKHLHVLFTETIRASDAHPEQTEAQQDAVARVLAEQVNRIFDCYDIARAKELYGDKRIHLQ